MLAPSHPMQKTFGFLWATLFYLTLLAQSSLLGLYNSHEGTSADQNEILWHLSPTLKTLGYEVRYHDVATSLPECRDHDVGIVTWFRSGEMK
jgi:hypothetical protein